MLSKKYFESGCMNEVEYSCKCSSPETLFCGAHIEKHVKLSNRAHNLESMLIQPCEEIKEAILGEGVIPTTIGRSSNPWPRTSNHQG